MLLLFYACAETLYIYIYQVIYFNGNRRVVISTTGDMSASNKISDPVSNPSVRHGPEWCNNEWCNNEWCNKNDVIMSAISVLFFVLCQWSKQGLRPHYQWDWSLVNDGKGIESSETNPCIMSTMDWLRHIIPAILCDGKKKNNIFKKWLLLSVQPWDL